ncbi:DUF1508 domain-containing protein [Nocardia sp. NPDC050435]|uniref:YegP family protein n=1 Tax=Nocardia sp. NPDC050435 TaxID=3155040 RepID=UPI0033F2AD34
MMAAKFEIYTGEDGKPRWRLVAPNGEKIAYGQGFASKAGAEVSISAVRTHAATARVVDLT